MSPIYQPTLFPRITHRPNNHPPLPKPIWTPTQMWEKPELSLLFAKIMHRFFSNILCGYIYIYTVLLMKSLHIRRSLFLITGSHHNPHDFRDYYSLVHQFPIAILTNTNNYIQEISVQSYFLNIMICICQNSSVARRPSAGEEGGMVALSHLPPFLGVEQKYFYGELVD